MRKILLLALAAPLFAACTPPATTAATAGGATLLRSGTEGRAVFDRPGTGQNAGGGAASVTGIMGDGRPTIERAPSSTQGVGCPPGTRLVTTNTTRGDRPTTACQ